MSVRREVPLPGGAEADSSRRWHCGLLVAAVAACYANSLRVPFLMDDPPSGWPLPSLQRPLVRASFTLNRALSGADTWSYHAFNALVHLACGFVLLGVLRRIAALAAPGLAARTREGLALVTTLVWLCHPLQTAAVTYVSQRAETLAALAYLGVLYAFLRSLQARRPRAWQALSLGALALGFATKEIVATAPLAVWLLDALLVAGGPMRALRARPAFYATLALATVALTAVFVLPQLVGNRTMGLGFEGFGPLEYARTQPGVLLHYLRLAFWPRPLVFDYGWPIARGASDWLPQTAALAVLLAVTVVLCLRRSWIGYAGAFFFVVLAPTSSIVPIKDPAFEHRVYLPLAALVALAVVASWRLLGRLGPRAARLGPVLAALLVVACGVLTVRRNRDYRTAVELWRVTVAAVPHHARAHANLGAALLDEGRSQEAVAALLESARLDPRLWYVYTNLGEAYRRLGQPELAARFHERAAALDPSRGARTDGGGSR